MIMYSVKASGFVDFGPHVYPKASLEPAPAGIGDATTQMDHNAVVLFTID